MLMDFGDSTVDVKEFDVGGGGESLEDVLPYAFVGPAVVADVDAMPVSEIGRKISPWRTGAVDPENRFEKEPIVPGGDASVRWFPGQERFDLGPLFVAEHHSFHGILRIRGKLILAYRRFLRYFLSSIENAL